MSPKASKLLLVFILFIAVVLLHHFLASLLYVLLAFLLADPIMETTNAENGNGFEQHNIYNTQKL